MHIKGTRKDDGEEVAGYIREVEDSFPDLAYALDQKLRHLELLNNYRRIEIAIYPATTS